jgi:sortase A
MGNLSIDPVKPGLHSYNVKRRLNPSRPKHGLVSRFRLLLLICGLACVGFYGYTLANQYIYQAYENWAFDQQIAGRTVSFTDWVREQTPLGTYMKPSNSQTAGTAKPTQPEEAPSSPPLAEGALVGKVLIPRLHLSAMVLQGVETQTLERGAGHVPSTAMPGQVGNFAIAAHRDTLFRPLKDIEKDDQVTFKSTSGSYTYQVVSTQIVLPSNVAVLRPPAGGGKWLTMITCYPFYYVGSAPKRFIVQAKLVSADSDSKLVAKTPGDSSLGTRAEPSPPPPTRKRSKPIKQASLQEPRHMRGSSSLARRRTAGTERADQSRATTNSAEQVASVKPKKKRGFWRRLASIL